LYLHFSLQKIPSPGIYVGKYPPSPPAGSGILIYFIWGKNMRIEKRKKWKMCKTKGGKPKEKGKFKLKGKNKRIMGKICPDWFWERKI
jgi:hypothetical protein